MIGLQLELDLEDRRDLNNISWVIEQYPPDADECDIMLGGIRLCRFVLRSECIKCKFACQDHTLGEVFPTKICLKDYWRVIKRGERIKLDL